MIMITEAQVENARQIFEDEARDVVRRLVAVGYLFAAEATARYA